MQGDDLTGYFEELVLFARGGVKVTSRRVIAEDGHSYALPDIISAEPGLEFPWGGRRISNILMGSGIALSFLLMTALVEYALAEMKMDKTLGGTALLAALALTGIAAAFLAPELIEKRWGRHVISIETRSQGRLNVYVSRDAAEAEMILRAIHTALLVGSDAAGFRAVFYHPPLHRDAEPEQTWRDTDLW